MRFPMKVIAIVASARKMHTYRNTKLFLQELMKFENIETELIQLNDYNLKVCKGCKICLDKNEKACPLDDDRDILLNKIENCDGLVWASPNYSFQVSGFMKLFLDRLGFYFHRPFFFGKTATNLVAQGIYGGKSIVKYLNFISNAMGFNNVKGIYFNTLEPISDKAQQKIENKIKVQAQKFYKQLVKKEFPKPSLFKIMLFRLSRSSMKMMLDEKFRDYQYFTEKGWFESDYYYPVKLNPLKKAFGFLFDKIAISMAKNN